MGWKCVREEMEVERHLFSYSEFGGGKRPCLRYHPFTCGARDSVTPWIQASERVWMFREDESCFPWWEQTAVRLKPPVPQSPYWPTYAGWTGHKTLLVISFVAVISRDVRRTCAVTLLYALLLLFYCGASELFRARGFSLDRVSIQLCFYEVRLWALEPTANLDR